MINTEAQKVIAALNKKMGGDVIVLGSDIRSDIIARFTTGSVTWDYILGGGLPGNQWTELIGEPSHGKTMLALKTVAANQAKNPDFTTVWVAAESWVPQYAELCGVDSDRVIVVETTVMEEAFDAVIAFAESKAVDAIVIDSLPALVPSPEAGKTMEELTIGRGALLINKFFRKVGSAMKRSLVEDERPVLGVIINQWRYKIGVMHGDPRTTPGGVGKDYAYFVRCEVKRDEWIEAGTGKDKKRIGQSVRIRTLKNKSAPPQRVAYVDYYFDQGGDIPAGQYDTAKEIVSMSSVFGILERKGGWYYYGDRKWQGLEAVLASVREEIPLAEELTSLVMAFDDRPLAVT